jgi:hypothetical protein
LHRSRRHSAQIMHPSKLQREYDGSSALWL